MQWHALHGRESTLFMSYCGHNLPTFPQILGVHSLSCFQAVGEKKFNRWSPQTEIFTEYCNCYMAQLLYDTIYSNVEYGKRSENEFT